MSTDQLPETMKGVVHKQSAGTLTLINDAALPVPNKDEHLIRIYSTALTSGELAWPRPSGLDESYPGVEASGTVVNTLPNSKFKPGDKVYFRTLYPRAGSAREYSIALESEMAMTPRNITADEAAAVPVSALTAWQALYTERGIHARANNTNKVEDRSIFINGASGGVGLWAVQLAKLAGFKVVGTSTNEEVVKRMGADEVINYKKTSITQWLKMNPDRRFDFVLDFVGNNSLAEAWHTARDGGLVLTFVPPADMKWKWDLETPAGINATTKGRFFLMESNGKQLEQITRLIEDKKVRPVVDSVYNIEEYDKAFDRVTSSRAIGKVVLRIRGRK